MEFEISGQQYRAGRLDTFKQFHVSRRLVPVLTAMVQSRADNPSSFDALVVPIAEAIAHMPDEECDFILHTCLAVAQRQQGEKWCNVFAPSSQSLMFDDIDMGAMIQITMKVIQENLAGFFAAGVASLTPATPAT